MRYLQPLPSRARVLVGAIWVASLLVTPGLAQVVAPTPNPQETITLIAATPKVCKLGSASPAAAAIEGAMVDLIGTRIGRLRTGLGPYQIEVPSWCNAPSTLTVVAAPMLGPSFIDGSNTAVFSRAVNFRARALGWTPITNAPQTLTAATRLGTLGPATGINAVSVGLPTDAPIIISLDNFAAPADELLVQGSYIGTVTITLGAN
jgi:hypothetical protein